jgi:hypothetical protein
MLDELRRKILLKIEEWSVSIKDGTDELEQRIEKNSRELQNSGKPIIDKLNESENKIEKE